jgi:hypothetical protein
MLYVNDMGKRLPDLIKLYGAINLEKNMLCLLPRFTIVFANALNLAGDGFELRQEAVYHSVGVLFALLRRVYDFRQKIDRASLRREYPGLYQFFLECLPLAVAAGFPASGYEDALLNFPPRLKGKKAHRFVPRSLDAGRLF